MKCSILEGIILNPGFRQKNPLNDVFIEPGARIKRAILDKECRVRAGASIGYSCEADKARGFTISENGITVVPKAAIVNRIEPSLL